MSNKTADAVLKADARDMEAAAGLCCVAPRMKSWRTRD